jgi:hypothetical protein
MSKVILSKKNKSGGITVPAFLGTFVSLWPNNLKEERFTLAHGFRGFSA